VLRKMLAEPHARSRKRRKHPMDGLLSPNEVREMMRAAENDCLVPLKAFGDRTTITKSRKRRPKIRRARAH
jgi:hypothetical protein